ncbi:MAG TPA: glycosyltransferase, partial [Ramlibacter sp.]|nr:glycosyltransferase [Ramlibacter sp.]
LRAGAAPNVQLLGHVSDEDKMCLLSLCRAFVFPSHLRSEAFGMSLVEAAMASRPMISCDIGTGTTFINQDGVTGWVVGPEEPEALRAAMQRLLENADQAATMGRAARARFESHFTAVHMAQAYEQVYRQVATARAGTFLESGQKQERNP